MRVSSDVLRADGMNAIAVTAKIVATGMEPSTGAPAPTSGKTGHCASADENAQAATMHSAKITILIFEMPPRANRTMTDELFKLPKWISHSAYVIA